METSRSNTSTANDVLHSENHSKLSAEDIAKAVAHHKRHHGENHPQTIAAKPGSARSAKV